MRFTSGPGATSGYSGFDFEKNGLDTQLDGPHWRLSVCVFDANTKSMRRYLDGQLLYDTSTTGIPRISDLPRVDSVFPKGPGEVAGIGQGGYIGGVAHMRMYKGVWTEDMIRQYHQGAAAKDVQLRECKEAKEFSDDPLWSDAFGHGCSWFAVAMEQRPLAKPCQQVAAKEKCPVACSSVTKCWAGLAPSSTKSWLLGSPLKRLMVLGSPVLCTCTQAHAHKQMYLLAHALTSETMARVAHQHDNLRRQVG